MGKSYKKQLKEERAKVKLKKAKTLLPKGQNLTDTNFKVKKIVIKDQIKIHEAGELLFRNKLNIKELISRLRHHNASIKMDALDGLKTLVASMPEDKLEMEFSTLVEAVVKLILSETNELRKAANRLLANLFSKSGMSERRPLYHMINSYLICGLTHIDRSIREDSLHFLDTVLKLSPKLCSDYASELVFICLDLVSAQSETSRTLSLNLDSRKGSKMWRSQVLQRILSLLQILAKHHKSYNRSNEAFSAQVARFVSFEPSKNWIPVFTPIIRHFQFDDSSVQNSPQETSVFELIDALIPVISQMFLEICPPSDMSKNENDPTTNISDEDASFLRTLAQIIDTLWIMCEKSDPTCSKNEEFKAKYGKNLIKNLIADKFPFSVKRPGKGRNVKDEDVSDSSCFSQNLLLAKLVFFFGDLNDWNLVIPYLKGFFRANDKLTPSDLVTLSTCVEKICRLKDCEEMRFFLSKTVGMAEGSNLFSSHSFKLLSTLALDSNLSYIHKDKDFESWLSTLPEKLTKKTISAFQVETICKMAVRNFPTFTDSLSGFIEVILDNLPRLEIVGKTDSNEKLRQDIAGLIFYVQDWDEEISAEIKTAIEKKYWGHNLTNYIENIIWLKERKLAGF